MLDPAMPLSRRLDIVVGLLRPPPSAAEVAWTDEARADRRPALTSVREAALRHRPPEAERSHGVLRAVSRDLRLQAPASGALRAPRAAAEEAWTDEAPRDGRACWTLPCPCLGAWT
mmetsp:Transcript_73226/g.203111  ORF Transcript_73226/g.203111 Transcript_73226/m.203111 type:complete len:116 (-) Transcript_73226:59-406(-)